MELTDLPYQGVTLEQVLGQHADEPLANLAAFDRMHQFQDKNAVRRLMDWIEPQAVCDSVIKWHGFDGLKRVTSGIARAASALRLPMPSRIRSAAGALGLEVF